MATDHLRLELHVDGDPRFAAAAGGAVHFLCEFAGMSDELAAEFQQATVKACLEAFQSAANTRHVIEVCKFDDRIEVTIDPNGGSAAIRLARAVSSAG